MDSLHAALSSVYLYPDASSIRLHRLCQCYEYYRRTPLSDSVYYSNIMICLLCQFFAIRNVQTKQVLGGTLVVPE